mgnify:CR=1 FL=1
MAVKVILERPDTLVRKELGPFEGVKLEPNELWSTPNDTLLLFLEFGDWREASTEDWYTDITIVSE